MTRNIHFKDWLAEQMRDPKFRAAMEELGPAYQVARLRIRRGLTQKELAGLVGTRQSGISRLESGKSQPSVSFLRRVAEALNAKLVVQLVPKDQPLAIAEMPGIASVEAGAGRAEGAILVSNWPGLETIQWSDRATNAKLEKVNQ